VLRGWKILRDAKRIYRGRNTFLSGAACFVVVNLLAAGMISGAGDNISLIVLAVAYSAITTTICYRLMWSGIFVMQGGIHIANIFSSFDMTWNEIDRLEMGRWKINRETCLVHTRDGQTRPANGLQESTNFPTGSAKKMVEELNQERPTQPESQSTSPA